MRKLSAKTGKRGRPKGGNKEAARQLGEDEKSIRNAKQHVAAADAFPVLKRKEWKQSQALAAFEYLEAMDDKTEAAIRSGPWLIWLVEWGRVYGR